MNNSSILFLVTIIFHLLIFSITNAEIKIITSIDNDIITNYDIKKEANYLKILNPELKKINSENLLELSKQSLITEIIKKNEITKFVNLTEANSLVDEYLQDLIIKLGYKNQEIFKEVLSQNKTYLFEDFKTKIKIELYWNDLVFKKYNNIIRIDTNKLNEKINELELKEKEYFLYEIILDKKNTSDLKSLKDKINNSINEIGFQNTASLYSIADTSKLGGKVGWIKEKFLNEEILDRIKIKKVGDHTDFISFKETLIILKVDQIREVNIEIDKDKELQMLISNEKNKKLEKFSRIFFEKVKVNYLVNE